MDKLVRHVAREARISAAINGAISAAFFWLAFGGSTTIHFWGGAGLLVDAIPQSFMVAVMGTLVPGLLARVAIGRGALQAPRRPLTVWRIVRQAASTGALAVAAGVLLTAAAGVIVGGSLPATVAAVAKVSYGALVGWLVTNQGLRRLLR